jgi:hypothetical protein
MSRTLDIRGFPWRPLVLAPLTLGLFSLAMYFYDKLQPEIALTLLGFAFAVPMVWIVLAAREAENTESPVRQLVPRLTVVLVLGSAFLALMMKDKYPRIPLIEAAFIIFYLAAGALTLKIFSSKPRGPNLRAVGGRSYRRNPGRHAPRAR